MVTDSNQNLLQEPPGAELRPLFSDVKIIHQLENYLTKTTAVSADHLILRLSFTDFKKCDSMESDNIH